MTALTVPVPGRRVRLRAAVRAHLYQVPAFVAIGTYLALWPLFTRTSYALRITGDVPSYITTVRMLAAHPLHSVSLFFPGHAIQDAQASPWMQLLAFVWRLTGDHGPVGADLHAMNLLFACAGLFVTGLLLHSFWLWCKRVASARTAWLAVPALLVVLGPPPVIWASDFSVHGLLYDGFYPQNVAMALGFYTLALLHAPGRRQAAAAAVLAALALTVHPLTGVLLLVVLSCQGFAAGLRREQLWWARGVIIAAAFGLACAWPAYSVVDALRGNSLSWLLVPALALVALCGRPLRAPGRLAAWIVGARRGRLLRANASVQRLGWPLLVLGAAVAVGLAVWLLMLLPQPYPDRMVNSNRLALYWDEDRWRWPLLYAGAIVGLLGLTPLAAGRRQATPLLWALACLGVGCVGAALSGLAHTELTLWYRLLLLAQAPLALGLGEVLASNRRRGLRIGVLILLACSGAFKVGVVTLSPQRNTYFGTELPDAYALYRAVPPGPGLVASDPLTSYYVPAVTGHPVITVSKGHVGSQVELAQSERGYRLLHAFFSSDQVHWWAAAQRLYAAGVRYVIFNKTVDIAYPTLERFGATPTPMLHSVPQLHAFFYRNQRVGRLLFTNPTYAVYELDGAKLGLCGRKRSC